MKRHLSGSRLTSLLVTLTALTFFTSSLAAQDTGAIAVRVVSEAGRPVVGALIVLDGTRPAGQSDSTGRLIITAVSAGTHTVSARRLGYSSSLDTVIARAGETLTLDVTLRTEPSVLRAVTVIGTRTDLDETRARMAEVPGAVSIIGPEELRTTRQANLADALRFTPGVFVQPRFGAADESQISIRGSGLRNNFHARGINLLVNGMPYRNADGFTDFESLELLTTQSVQIYKGANALRYGGSTLGGAVNLDTKTGHVAAPIAAFGQAGSFGFSKLQVESGHTLGAFDYYASYARTSLDGYRDWSAQRRDRVNLHAGHRLSSTVDTRAFYFFARVNEQLPGALTRAAFDANRRQADPNNRANRWGRDYDLHHIGIQLRAQLSPTQRLEVSPYTQYRDIDHPIFEVISQISRDYGAEIRYENTMALGTRQNRFTLGVQPALQNMDNRQFQNVVGEHGALTRDEKDKVLNLAVYAENSLEITDRLTAVAGARFDYSRRTVDDAFLTNGDQSDRRVFEPVTPRIGLRYDIPAWGGSIFANASRTVEPPLLLELSSFGNAGGFIPLEAQKAWQYELGVRGERVGFAWELAFYDIELRDELLNINVRPFPGASFTVPTYRNADRTRHSGAEVGVSYQLPGAVLAHGAIGDQLIGRLSYTFSRYRYVNDPAYGGNEIPGAPSHHLNAELRYTHPVGVSVTPSVEWVPAAYYVNSENTIRNDAWSALAIRAEWSIARAGLTAFLEGRNLLDRRYSGSVQVDNAAGGYYEPADARSVFGGVRWTP
jgi:iron complex outermembrane receptor protein